MDQLRIAKRGQCNNYCIFIAARHFETFQDFINLEMAVKRFRGTLEKFHYNPISLTKEILPFFPNIQTLYLYEKEDKFLTGQRIERYRVWYRTSCSEAKKMREGGKAIEFMKMKYTCDDMFYEYEMGMKEHGGSWEYLHDFIIPEGVKEIEWIDMKITNSIVIPASVTKIGRIEVSETPHEYVVPSHVKELGGFCFSQWEELTDITLPNGLTSIPDSCFNHCDSLETIVIPSSVISIGNNAFAFCSSLKEITIPESVTSIGNLCFYENFSLTKITIPTSVVSLGKCCFEGCGVLSLSIPTSVTMIGERCFMWMGHLTSIDIPLRSGQRVIGNDIYWEEEGVLTSMCLSSNVVEINGEKVEPIEEFTIPTTVTKISDHCFYMKTKLRTITIPTSVEEIGVFSFSHCSSLTSLTIPTSVTKICRGLCFECDSLKTIYVPTTLKEQLKYYKNKLHFYETQEREE